MKMRTIEEKIEYLKSVVNRANEEYGNDYGCSGSFRKIEW